MPIGEADNPADWGMANTVFGQRGDRVTGACTESDRGCCNSASSSNAGRFPHQLRGDDNHQNGNKEQNRSVIGWRIYPHTVDTAADIPQPDIFREGGVQLDQSKINTGYRGNHGRIS